MSRIEFCTKKSVGALVYLPWSGPRGLEGLSSLKYYNIQKWESRFSLGLNAAKIVHYMRKHASNNSCLALNSVKKSQWVRMSISLRNGAKGLERLLPSLKYYNVQKWESTFSLWLNAARNTHYMRERFK